MYLDTNKKKTIFKKHGQSEKDTGKSESQIAVFTERINHLTKYLNLCHSRQWINSRNAFFFNMFYFMFSSTNIQTNAPQKPIYNLRVKGHITLFFDK